jgi:hypothetical protein
MLDNGEVTVNHDYQRSDKVWPAAARSFLIETILLGYPMPKLSMHQKTDVKSRRTIKEIVDGQQRTQAIVDFSKNELKLARLGELEDYRGRRYNDLDDDLQGQFLSYPIDVDLFTGASDEEIREVFRRMNSYTVPLNPEETRYSIYQGAMKWFVYGLARTHDTSMLKLGTFSQKNLARMADSKLYAEIIHAVLNGIATTKKQQLDALYRENDKQFARATEVKERLDGAVDLLLAMEGIQRGPLVKPHQTYSLVLALMHLAKPIASLKPLFGNRRPRRVDPATAEQALVPLAEALEAEPVPPSYRGFVKASTSKTNVKAQRERRFKTYCGALRP